MNIIDAHVHCRPGIPSFEQKANELGHVSTAESFVQAMQKVGIVHAIEQGTLNPEEAIPKQLSYTVGIESGAITCSKSDNRTFDEVDRHLSKKNCVGIKVFAGYNARDITDEFYWPFYDLTGAHNKIVAIHTGATAVTLRRGLLKYAHPQYIDSVASAFSKVNFVMCHMGNPWIQDAAAVIERHPNVYTDLSGLFEQRLTPDLLERQKAYTEWLKMWIRYVDDYEKFLFGTDWPLVDCAEYIEYIQSLIPENQWDLVFYENAKELYGLKV